MPRFELPSLTTTRLLDVTGGPLSAARILTGRRHWYRFAQAYKRAADRLAELSGTGSGVNEDVALPMLFLYRHYVELHLKSLLLDAGELLDDPQSFLPKHYLTSLWKRVRSLLLQIEPNADDPWLVRADSIIQQLDTLDPTSFAFRYPVDTAGDPSLSSDLVIDPKTAASVIAELHLLLDGASTQIDVYMTYKNDMR